MLYHFKKLKLKTRYNYVLINIYAPNKDKDIVAFLTKLLITLQNEDLDSENNIVIGGDFNCPLNPTIDKKGGILIQRKSVKSWKPCTTFFMNVPT